MLDALFSRPGLLVAIIIPAAILLVGHFDMDWMS